MRHRPRPSVTGHTEPHSLGKTPNLAPSWLPSRDNGDCSHRGRGQALAGRGDRFVQFADPEPVRGHYWSGLRCGLATKTRPVKRKELTIDERR